jgi:hypothetical protein
MQKGSLPAALNDSAPTRKTPTVQYPAYGRWKASACSIYGQPDLMVGQRPPWSRAAKQKDPMILLGGFREIMVARFVCPESFA